MTVSSKIRIYDLAKELKLDTKRLIEEVRREGVDVSVPSNSVSKELAEKIRNKYFPKKETAVKRAVKVVKRAARPVEEASAVEAEPETVAPEPVAAVPAPIEALTPAPVAPPKPTTARLVKKLTPAARAEQPADVAVEALPPPVEVIEEIEMEPELAVPVEPAPPEDGVTDTKSVPPPSRQIRVMRPTA